MKHMEDHKKLNDFATLFSYSWYRDFPIDSIHRDWGRRADWTIHLGVTFRRVADLMGYFSHFESGGRTDLVIRDNNKNPITFCEWEWGCPGDKGFNEIQKLTHPNRKAEFGTLFTYCNYKEIDKCLAIVQNGWTVSHPLLLILMTFDTKSGGRHFQKMCFHQFSGEGHRQIRTQDPTPWSVVGSRWQKKATKCDSCNKMIVDIKEPGKE